MWYWSNLRWVCWCCFKVRFNFVLCVVFFFYFLTQGKYLLLYWMCQKLLHWHTLWHYGPVLFKPSRKLDATKLYILDTDLGPKPWFKATWLKKASTSAPIISQSSQPILMEFGMESRLTGVMSLKSVSSCLINIQRKEAYKSHFADKNYKTGLHLDIYRLIFFKLGITDNTRLYSLIELEYLYLQSKWQSYEKAKAVLSFWQIPQLMLMNFSMLPQHAGLLKLRLKYFASSIFKQENLVQVILFKNKQTKLQNWHTLLMKEFLSNLVR